MKNLMIEISKYRPIIIFDYIGEHRDLRFPNFNSITGMDSIPDLFTLSINDFAFTVGDFNEVCDWVAFGLNRNTGALQLSYLAGLEDMHKNNPKHFLKMLNDLPTTQKELTPFNNYYKCELEHTINQQTKQSMISKFDLLYQRGIFLDRQNGDQRKVVGNWGKLLVKYPHLHINFCLTETDVGYARAYIGKILKYLIPYLPKLNPALFFEEAIQIFPVIMGDEMPTSLVYGCLYVTQLQKLHMEMFFVIQDSVLLFPSIWNNAHTKILGQINSKEHPETKGLYWNVEKNVRHFNYYITGKGRYETFVPDDVKCLL